MDLSEPYNMLITFALGLPRMLAIFIMIPIFGRSVLIGSARMVIATSFVLILYPVLDAQFDPIDLPIGMLTLIVVKEVAIGMLMGFGLGAVFWAIESFGFFIDNQRGSAMASSVDPLTGTQTSPLGIFMMQVITVFYMVGGAFVVTLLAIYQSYVALPVGSFWPDLNIGNTRYFLEIADRIMALALIFAAPAMIAMFLSELALGLVSRFAPALNVFFLAMPVKSAVGIMMLILYVGLLPVVWNEEFLVSATHIRILGGLLGDP